MFFRGRIRRVLMEEKKVSGCQAQMRVYHEEGELQVIGPAIDDCPTINVSSGPSLLPSLSYCYYYDHLL